MKTKVKDPEAVVKEMFWLAWQACGGPFGMGVLQNKPAATKDDVWNNVATSGDYVGGPHTRPNEVYGDYVFGRMVKLSLTFDTDTIAWNDRKLDPEYQAWCIKYPTYQALFDAATNSLDAQ